LRAWFFFSCEFVWFVHIRITPSALNIIPVIF
jgi:hypothetical protein